jgi:hypothetical protein
MNSFRLSSFAYISASMELLTSGLMNHSPLLVTGGSIVFLWGIFGSQNSSSSLKELPKDWHSAYEHPMFDYPRKKDDGGTTETKKIVDGFKKLADKIRRAIPTSAPSPGFVPVPIRRRALNLQR